MLGAIVAFLFATVHPELWPARKPPARDARIEAAVEKLLRAMTLEEKVGQVIQPSIVNITPDEVRDYHIGSVLNGGGGWRGDVRKATPREWLALADAFYAASMDASNGRRAIPVMWGADAVIGHDNIVGDTHVSHNIGLGESLLSDV